MNNLVLGLIVIGTATSVWLGEYLSVRSIRVENDARFQQLASLRATLEETTQALSEAQSDLENRRRELDLRGREAASVADELKRLSQVSLDPASEGLWPADKPYMYVAKKHLSKFSYFPFGPVGPEHRISPISVALLGMSGAEEKDANQAFEGFYLRMGQLQAGTARLLEPAAGFNDENHREVSYQIPDLINEVGALRADLEATLRALLGNTRTDLLWQRFPKAHTGLTGDHAYLMTYYASRNPDGTVQHLIRESHGSGGGEVGVMFPPVPGTALWQWRHLFGLEPLLPLPDVAHE